MLVFNYVWDIPYASRAGNWAVRNVFGNWELSGTTQFQSGSHMSVSTGDDFAGVGPGSGNQLWRITAPLRFDKKSSPNNSKSAYWFDPTVFQKPATGTFAPRETRNQVYGPGFQNWNIAVQKSFPIASHESQRINFKAEAFNFVNHPNLDNPNTNPTSTSNFGKVTGKAQTYASDRQLQFSLRYQF